MEEKDIAKNKGKNSGVSNLKPWKPGQSGNPLGRPKKELSMTNALREILNEVNPETKIERYKELLAVALDKAMKGDGDMLKYLINRIEGLPKGEQTQTNNIVVIPLLGGDSVQADHSYREAIETKEED